MFDRVVLVIRVTEVCTSRAAAEIGGSAACRKAVVVYVALVTLAWSNASLRICVSI